MRCTPLKSCSLLFEPRFRPATRVASVEEARRRLRADPNLLYFGPSVTFSDDEDIMSLNIRVTISSLLTIYAPGIKLG